MMSKDPQTYAIIGAAMEVHKRLGCDFLENVYQEALQIEFQHRDIPFKREVSFDITYRDIILPCKYKVDFVCHNEILVELKALKSLTSLEESQVINYLKASQFNRVLLINFGAKSLEYKRMVYTH